jgi:hypothetical protein
MSKVVIPTSMALAFLNATAREINQGKADVVKGTGNWIARHVAIKVQDPRFTANQRPMRSK